MNSDNVIWCVTVNKEHPLDTHEYYCSHVLGALLPALIKHSLNGSPGLLTVSTILINRLLRRLHIYSTCWCWWTVCCAEWWKGDTPWSVLLFVLRCVLIKKKTDWCRYANGLRTRTRTRSRPARMGWLGSCLHFSLTRMLCQNGTGDGIRDRDGNRH